MEIKQHPILEKTLQDDIYFYFNDKKMKAKKGQTVAGALMANGILEFGRSRKLNQARGLYCGVGRCMSCYVTINNQYHILSCTTLLEEGMKVYSNNSDPKVGSDVIEN
ncbi:(2Fe-2S)-binding protein [Pallidibacillus thermolactis]|jgi:sarcosine oxidase, subunit alpha|uniref:(2Fe-2S)-binding protein n=1 Tax=Pallidibacillus thermolactis TaxID=251051 RepID=UPI0021D8F346|nr:(2Fe-2S)-binding protein [Pallidibacillus thermolactis]MCU9602704.1 (2Fe-2S)-binding protein [Pallidibacillus thermolactis subsp. kokeshiiformis]